ncbi:MAG: GNAT family N-acetyltransferase [Proteobacteria bacterium]|nr:GNAT family N-acetyltransferase [Pseudomonadota bacterium]
MKMKPAFTLIRVNSIAPELEALIEAANAEGFPFMQTLRREWDDGGNRFDRQGEAYFAVRHHGRLIAAGGLNHDPYAGRIDVGRVRHVYVMEPARRGGAGKLLIGAIVSHARDNFSVLRLRTRTAEGAAFYEALGFSRCGDETATHILSL